MLSDLSDLEALHEGDCPPDFTGWLASDFEEPDEQFPHDNASAQNRRNALLVRLVHMQTRQHVLCVTAHLMTKSRDKFGMVPSALVQEYISHK